MLKKLNQYFEEVLCTFFLSVVFISVITQVVLRFGFSSAAVWAEETAVYGLIFVTSIELYWILKGAPVVLILCAPKFNQR